MGGTPNNTSNTERVRLHITPFNPELLDRIIAPSIRPLASNISFHTVQTFPERGFGYIELPIMEAKKLKSKLNGSTLKGSKVRIDEAKPEKKRKGEPEEEGREAKVRKTLRKEGKKRKEGVLSGYELEEGRRVKRGWAETDADVKNGERLRRASKFREANGAPSERKLRFKTSILPNHTPIESSKTGKTKEKKDKDSKSDRKKVVVQEFAKTQKPVVEAVGPKGAGHGTLSYEDGKGWVDEAGEVIEAERPSRKPKRRSLGAGPTSSSKAMESVTPVDIPTQPIEPENMSLDDASSESTKSNGTHSNHSEDEATAEQDANETGTEVHPLEALFKKPAISPTDSAKRRPKPILTSFSFFDPQTAGEDGQGDEGMKMGMPPQTPHTQRDMEWRSLRSAAPTPDTAAIGRKFSFPFAQQNIEEDDEQADGNGEADMPDADPGGEGAAQVGAQDRGEESAFRKWFYDNRGDLNRGWKKRRRDEKKRHRQTENRRLSQRIV